MEISNRIKPTHCVGQRGHRSANGFATWHDMQLCTTYLIIWLALVWILVPRTLHFPWTFYDFFSDFYQSLSHKRWISLVTQSTSMAPLWNGDPSSICHPMFLKIRTWEWQSWNVLREMQPSEVQLFFRLRLWRLHESNWWDMGIGTTESVIPWRGSYRFLDAK